MCMCIWRHREDEKGKITYTDNKRKLVIDYNKSEGMR